ncbi:TonB-dependent receptor [Adhaeribacter sp. BT258]|uniref:TonB-dependent receptor n=1 Tax=Adhaeribacter terrigena TaxID=2793070 RepID=A0ABS1BYM6_9BACT|nr:TonB-dependent receptor [Adhaeribacter terrigena]MBK0401493.1 TonB-dependent receptor [Adhaeribacter terrigena]
MFTFLRALLVLMLLPAFAFAQFTLSGTVSDAATNQPLPGASVQLSAKNGQMSDAAGNFTFTNLEAGNYTVRVSYLGFEPVSQTVELTADKTLAFPLQKSNIRTGEVVITATRANDKTGTTFTNVSKEELEERNFGQDIPYLLEQTPSVVVNSDAGAGVGYTGIRIRGSDITRINVTINGVPVNDAESHGAFFVNMPDLASSIQDIQIQRGVGTSTNGAAAFGASMNIRTLGLNREAYLEATNGYGSFNTWRHSVSFGTGLINDKFTLDARLSKISSDGYVDRAFSDLKSYYVAAGYHGKTGSLKFVTFSGVEKTYQAWNGIPQDSLKTNRTYNSLTYENETDNYQQDHYQLHYSKNFGSRFDFGGAFHFTRGRGYYEQYKDDRKLSNYGIEPLVLGDTTIKRTDLIQQKWLDNYFYGATFAANYYAPNERLTATIGGGWNTYDGDHFGEVIWAQYASNSNIRHRWYENKALKTDFNIFARVNYQATEKLGLFGDLQHRIINYEINGFDDKFVDASLPKTTFNFWNPKAGATYAVTNNQAFYASFAVGNREPVRSDFTDQPLADREAGKKPMPETMYNWEAGYRLRGQNATLFGTKTRYSFDANYYFMDYKNQLVLTGQLNDVGSPLRTNIKDSYRQGIELSGVLNLNELVELSSNLTVSRNKIQNYTETVYVYNEDYVPETIVENKYSETDISFSPEVISAHKIEVQPLTGLKIAALYKTVSKQFLDNTSSENRMLNSYGIMDLRLRYTIKPAFMRELEFALLVNNVLNEKYEANGYTFSEMYSGDATRYDYNYYYPQATRNFMVSVGMKF